MKKIGVCILALMILMPLVVAVNINIKTLPSYRVSIIIREAGKLTTAESFHKDTGTGDVSVKSGVGYSNLDILVTLKKDGKIIINKKFESISTSGPININFMSESEAEIVESFEEPEEAVEETETEEVVAEEESVEEVEKEKATGKITGFIVGGGKAVVSSKITYYVIGGIVIIGALVLLVFIMRKNIRKGDLNLKKNAQQSNRTLSSYDRKLEDAEKKLDEAKKELDELKNRKSRLEEARERFKRDQKELERMEKGY